MSASEKRVAKVIWRALGRHVKAGHKLEVRRMLDNEEMEISCSWCGGTVLAGSAGFVREIVERLNDSGIPVADITARFIKPGMLQHG